MSRIEALTPEQEALLPVYAERWTRIGLATGDGRIDLRRVRPAIHRAYRCAGLPPPARIIRSTSPLAGMLCAVVVGASVRDSVRDSVGASVRDSVRDSVWASVGASVWASVWASCYGAHDAHWLGYYSYFGEVLRLDISPLDGLMRLARLIGWWCPYERAVIVTPLPTSLHRDARGRLHCADALAIGYRDGWGVYAWHGVRVPERVILRPDELTTAEVLGERNAEIRRVMIERIGMERIMDRAEVVSTDARGRLLRLSFDDDEPVVAVEVEDATEHDGMRRRYLLRVPPYMQTARDAVAWTWGMTRDEYVPEVET